MRESERFEIKIPADRRRELEALADRMGLKASQLARLAIVALLDRRAIEVPPQKHAAG